MASRPPQGRSSRRARRGVVAIALMACALAISGAAAASRHAVTTSADTPDFGPNVKIFDPSMSTSPDPGVGRRDLGAAGLEPVRDAALRAALHARQLRIRRRSAQLPGRLLHRGRRPRQLAERRHHQRHDRLLQPVLRAEQLHRARELLAVAVEPDASTSRASRAASPASSGRRHRPRRCGVSTSTAFATLMDYCTAPSYASGGFIADSQFSGGTIVNGSQQQYLVRNSDVDGWSNGVWNQVFAGVNGAPPQSFPNPPYTTLRTNPASREKPYLYRRRGRALQRLRPRCVRPTRPARRGRTARRPAIRSRSRASSSRSPRTASSRSTTRCRAERT